MKSVRVVWSFFKKGYLEFTYFLSPLQLGLTLYTALILTLTGTSKSEVFFLLIGIGILTGLCMVTFGRWQYHFKRSFYKKDVEVEALNNPLTQAQNRLFVEIAKKVGVNTSDFEKNWVK